MDKIDTVSLLKELDFYSRLLEKHEASKKEKELKFSVSQQAIIGQQYNKSKFCKVTKNLSNPISSFNQKYSLKKSTHPGIADQNKGNGLYNPRQNMYSKYPLPKNRILNRTSPVNKFVVNKKNFKSNVSIVHTKTITDFKSDSIKVPCVSANGSGKSTYNTKDFIKEVESLTELIKKKTSGSPLKNLNSVSKCENATQNKQFSHKKDQNNVFDNLNFMKKERSFSKAKGLIGLPSRMHSNINYPNRRNYSMNSDNKNNSLQGKAFNTSKFIYKKNNVNPLLNRNIAASLKNIGNKCEIKDGLQKISSKPASRKLILSNSKNLSHDLYTSGSAGVLQRKSLSSSTKELIVKLHTPMKIYSSNRKILKKSPEFNKINSPVLLKIKSSNTIKTPKIRKLKQTNTRYKKINKHLTTSNKRMQLQHSIQQKSIKNTRKKVNKYKVINKTLISSNKMSDSKIIQPSLAKMSFKLDNKKTPFKKSKSRISKYKIINSNVSQKYSLTNMQSVHMVTPPKNERAVLVRRLFKSKNVIINKNATPTSYSAKMIKSKYLSLNKRKSFSQKYMYPTVSQHPKFKESYFSTKLHPKQKRFKTNAVSMHHSRLIRKTNYACQIYKNKQIYKNSRRKGKSKITNRYAHSPVVFIRGTRYAKNLNGRTLRKLPIKGHTVKNLQRASVKNLQRASGKLIIRTENLIKASPASINLASRVLHRSINRILLASSKKSLSKVSTYCMFYNRFGRCNRGVKCSYIHDPSKIAVCTRFLRGTCKIDGCPFSHEVDPGKMAICSFFLVGQCDKENCPYRHEKLSSNAVLCKEFVQGYCHYGKECKKAHILICPKYVQGECDKGSLCAFPHPPQKAKKNIRKEVEDEETRPTEVLLEKVLRYFQQGGDSQNESEKSTSNLFVPKQRKLEEQPSFIPLSASPVVNNKKI